MCGKIFLNRRVLFLILSVSFLAACNDVSFAPGDPKKLTAGMTVTDSFIQGFEKKKLDVLFVVDNSGSMAPEQLKMGERIDSFLSTLMDVDWQLGITTTDVSDGTYGLKGDLLVMEGTSSRVLKPTTPDYMNVFKNTVVRPESECTIDCPSGNEQALRAAIMAMEKRNTTNRGFFRDGAELGLLVLSDEDEMSIGPPDATAPFEVINTMEAIWGEEKDLYTYGMVIVPGDAACLSTQGGNGHYGTFVAQLANLTQGLVGSICENDYAPTLGMLGDNVRKLLGYVQLRAKPVFASIAIEFSPAHVTTWTIKGRRLYFQNPPPKGTLIKVQYEVQ